MNIGSIIWPAEPNTAIKYYLKFLVIVVESSSIVFSDDFDDPVEITKKFINDEIPNSKYRKTLEDWWNYIDENESIRDFSDERILSARIAICLLSLTEEDASELGEHMSWFFELLDRKGIGLEKPIKEMQEYFDFKK